MKFGLPSHSLGSAQELTPVIKPAYILLRLGTPERFRGWARQDSNLGPRDYESPALTAELQARATRN